MPRRKDCGCGKGPKHCVSKARRGGQEPQPATEVKSILPTLEEQQAQIKALAEAGNVEEAKKLTAELIQSTNTEVEGKLEEEKAKIRLTGAGRAQMDASYLLKLYIKEKGKPTKGGAALKKDMMKFARKKLKEMDCGCGCKGMKKLGQLSGGAMRDCPGGWTDIGLFCRKDCPGGYRNDGIYCRGCPPGFEDWGLHCQRYIPIYDKGWDGWLWRGLGGGYIEYAGQDAFKVEYMEKIDWAATAEEIKKGFEDAFSANGPLAAAFDPEKNGVADAFRKFGEDTEAAFKDLGEKMEKAFDPNQNGVADAFKKLGDDLAFLGDDDWWRETMSDPDTYIFLIGTIASVAAMCVTGGLAAAALGAIGPTLNMINSAAKGESIDPLDIAGLALAIVPAGASAIKGLTTGAKPLSSAIPATEKVFLNSIKAQQAAQQGLDKGTRLARLGQTLANGTKSAVKAAVSGAKAFVKGQIMSYVGFIDEAYQLGRQAAVVLKNPKAILKALQLSPKLASGTRFVPWNQLSRTAKAVRAIKAGVMVVKKGVQVTNLGIKIARNGEVIGLWNIPEGVDKNILLVEEYASLADKLGTMADQAAEGLEAGAEGRYVDMAENALNIVKEGEEAGLYDVPDINEDPKNVNWDEEQDNVIVVETDGSDELIPDSEIIKASSNVDPMFEARRARFIMMYGVTPEYYLYTLPESEMGAIYERTKEKAGLSRPADIFFQAREASGWDLETQGFKNNPRYAPGPRQERTRQGPNLELTSVVLESPYPVPGYNDLSQPLGTSTTPGAPADPMDPASYLPPPMVHVPKGVPPAPCPPNATDMGLFCAIPTTNPKYALREAFKQKYGISPESFLVEVEPFSAQEDAIVAKGGVADAAQVLQEAQAASGWGFVPGGGLGFVDNPFYDNRVRFENSWRPGVTLEAITGAGRQRRMSLVELNMDGKGFSEDTAYMGIDMSPLEGSGVPHHSWEAWYDKTSAENHAKKVDLVRRRAAQRTVKILPYTERPALLSDTFKVDAGRDIHGQMAGGGIQADLNYYFSKMLGATEEDASRVRRIQENQGMGKKSKVIDNPILPPSLDTTAEKATRAMSRMAKAARRARKMKGGMKGGDWFSPSTWTWESVNPVNWTTEDWSNVGKGIDAAIFGTLSDPKILAAAAKAVETGASLTLPPPIGVVSGATLAGILTGAVAAHEYVYPSCEKGKGVFGCNEYRKEVDEVIRTATDIYSAYENVAGVADRVGDWLTSGIDLSGIGDYMGTGAYRGAFTRGEPQAGETEEKFYYPQMSGREARGVAAAGGEYAGPQMSGLSSFLTPPSSVVF